MSLSLREKQLFYDQLGQLLRAGVPMQQALVKLTATARGGVAAFLRSLQGEVAGGASLSEAFQRARPALSEMEQITLGGLARSGQMEAGLRQLSTHFAALATARREVKSRLLYPLFLLHFGVLVLNAPLLITDSTEAYLRATGIVFGLFYAVLLVGALLVHFLQDAGSFMATVDAVLRLLPFLGKVRRAFAISRFCGTYNMLLEAGVNVIDSLHAAGRASRSGLIVAAVQRTLPAVRQGGQAGEGLARSPRALTPEVLGAIQVAEQTGRLDQTLTQLAEEHQAEALRRLSLAAEWIPRLLYLSILLYLGWEIVHRYLVQMRQFDSILDSE